MKCAAGLLVFASLVFFVSADPKTLCDLQDAEFTALASCVRAALGDGDLAKKLGTIRANADCATDACLHRKLCEQGTQNTPVASQFTPEEKAEFRRHAIACKQAHP
uniref:Putative microplusin preprotein n=1 Tax=Ixodes ricinus TaxID=34613 RepID=A0A090XAL2_IXORI